LSQTFGSVIDAVETSIFETVGVTSRIQTDNAGCFIVKVGKNDLTYV
jgi:hypothetical protein